MGKIYRKREMWSLEARPDVRNYGNNWKKIFHQITFYGFIAFHDQE